MRREIGCAESIVANFSEMKSMCRVYRKAESGKQCCFFLTCTVILYVVLRCSYTPLNCAVNICPNWPDRAMAQTELLFALLTTGECCEANDWIKALKRLHPERIDWSSRNDDGLTILVQCVIVLLRNSSCEQEMLNMIEHFISYGASITQKCTAEASATFVFYKDSDGDELLVKPSGLSAISYVQAWAREFDVDTRFSDESKRLAKALNCFAGAETQHVRVPVYEGIIELWEKFLTAESAHDLTIEAADGLVTAHAQMLKEASAVVTAMLASPMKEGQLQRIQVKDVAKREVSLFLEMPSCSAVAPVNIDSSRKAPI